MNPMKLRKRLPRTVSALLLAAGCAASAWAQEAAPDGAHNAASTAATAAEAEAAIVRYLQVQPAGLPGKVTIRLEGRGTAALPACDNPEVFLPPGATPWGRVSVGV